MARPLPNVAVTKNDFVRIRIRIANATESNQNKWVDFGQKKRNTNDVKYEQKKYDRVVCVANLKI